MEKTKISLSRILQLRVPVAWHEAVAISQGVADCFGSIGAAPGLDTYFLTLTGDVEIEGVSRTPYDGDLAVHVLTLMLDRERAPKELSALVTRYRANNSVDAGDFSRELAFFARPDPISEISAVASRAIAMDHEAGTQAQLEQLRQTATPVPPPPPSNSSPRRLRPWVIGIGGLAAVAALFVVIGSMPVSSAENETASAANETAPGNETPAQPTTVQKITSGLGTLVEAGLSSLGLGPETPTPPASSAVAAAPRKAVQPRARKPQLVVRGGAPALVQLPSSPAHSGTSTAGPSLDPPAVNAPSADENPLRDVDSGFEPPVLVRPQMRSEPSNMEANSSTTYLELVVNEFGRVDRVQLHSPRSTLHDRMLISAAKAWVFSPARQNGQPIKYVMRVPITREPQQ